MNKQYEAASRVRGFYSSLMEIYAMVSLWRVNLLCVKMYHFPSHLKKNGRSIFRRSETPGQLLSGLH